MALTYYMFNKHSPDWYGTYSNFLVGRQMIQSGNFPALIMHRTSIRGSKYL